MKLGRVPRGVAAEWVFAGAVGAGAAHAAWRLATDGYLPQPFLYNPGDTLMDWYYPAYWAQSGDAYRDWHAVYPPLSFAWTYLFSTPWCYHLPSLAIRDCDRLGGAVLTAFWAANGVLALLALRRVDGLPVAPRVIALALGLPALFALERGNLITPALTFFILAWGRLLRPGAPRALALGMALNFKPYLLPVVAGLATGRRRRALILAGWAAATVYVATWAVAGGSPAEIIANLRLHGELGSRFPVSEIYQPTSFNAFAAVLDHGAPMRQSSGPGLNQALAIGHAVLGSALVAQIIVQALLVAALAGAVYRPGALPHARVGLLALLLTFVTVSPGGYALVFPLFLLFIEPTVRAAGAVALVCGYALSVPWDWIIIAYPDTPVTAWLSGREVTARFGLSAGMLARPAILLAMAAALAADSLAAVLRTRADD